MADLPYVKNTGKVSEYFAKIQDVGVPEKATVAWLKSVGFKSSNDTYTAAFLKDMGFADSSGIPTDRWHRYRHSEAAPQVMAEALRETYAPLFSMYADAAKKDDEAIRNWMRAHASKASPSTIDRALATFRGLCKLADFDAGGPSDPVPAAPNTAAVPASPPNASNPSSFSTTTSSASGGGPSIHINVELHLPASASADDYDSLFAAMRKHLFSESSTAD